MKRGGEGGEDEDQRKKRGGGGERRQREWEIERKGWRVRGWKENTKLDEEKSDVRKGG